MRVFFITKDHLGRAPWMCASITCLLRGGQRLTECHIIWVPCLSLYLNILGRCMTIMRWNNEAESIVLFVLSSVWEALFLPQMYPPWPKNSFFNIVLVAVRNQRGTSWKQDNRMFENYRTDMHMCGRIAKGKGLWFNIASPALHTYGWEPCSVPGSTS